MIDYHIFWLVTTILAITSIVIILLFTIRLDKPKNYSRLPVYIFFTLSTFAICLILSISFFPNELFSDFPISTIKFKDDNNATQWVLNIGGVSQSESLGIQIPLFVIVLGILGAYIRYLYLGIQELKIKLGKILFKFEKLERKLKDTNEELKRVEGDPQINKVLPVSILLYLTEYANTYKKRQEKIESEYNAYRYKVNFETISHVLSTVGFFLLAPLLSIMGWLILSIGGTENNMTFALVSITAGFTAKAIIGKAMSLVEGKFTTDDEKNNTPIIFLKPTKEQVGKTLTVSGKKFKENSIITITFDEDEIEIESQVKTDEKGSFTQQIQIPQLEPGTYDISVKDEENNSAEKEFEIIQGLNIDTKSSPSPSSSTLTPKLSDVKPTKGKTTEVKKLKGPLPKGFDTKSEDSPKTSETKI